MRRIYHIKKSTKRQKLEDELIRNLRDVRQNIDPEALENARQAIASKTPQPETFAIDRTKNLYTILTFLKKRTDQSPEFQAEIMRIIEMETTS